MWVAAAYGMTIRLRSGFTKCHVALAITAVSLLASDAARASDIIGTSSIEVIAPPTTLNLEGQGGALESDDHAFVFREQTRTLLNEVTVDAALPGTYDAPIDGQLAVGRDVDCFLLHADKVGTDSGQDTIYTGSITFSSDILGVAAAAGTLQNAGIVFGLEDVAYPSGEPALEFDRGDTITLSDDRRTLSYHLTVESDYVWAYHRLDELRILVDAGTPAADDPIAGCSMTTRRSSGSTGTAMAGLLIVLLAMRRPSCDRRE